MNDAKGKFIASDGNVISFEKMSKKLSELSGTSQYFDYVYYNPETKTYSVNKKAMTKDDFIKSDYDYGIGAYIHLDEDPNDENVIIAHYELIKRNPFIKKSLSKKLGQLGQRRFSLENMRGNSVPFCQKKLGQNWDNWDKTWTFA